MRLPRGVRLANERIENGHVTWDVRVARWRMMLMVFSSLRHVERTVRVVDDERTFWWCPTCDESHAVDYDCAQARQIS